MANKDKMLERLKGGLIVSCQALKNEPLYSPYIMSRMAFAAQEGGAAGIRANSPKDIAEIKNTVNLPIIGLYKVDYDNSEIYITPTEKEIDELIKADADIIAMDATDRLRPDGSTISELFPKIRAKYPELLFMADCSTYEEGIQAQVLGFDLVATTLCGYTRETKGTQLPCISLIQKLSADLRIPLVAEGGIWEPKDLAEVLRCGAFAAVVGTAITRPGEITKRFVDAIREV